MMKVESVRRMVEGPRELASERPKQVLRANTQSEAEPTFHFAKTSWSVGGHKQILTYLTGQNRPNLEIGG